MERCQIGGPRSRVDVFFVYIYALQINRTLIQEGIGQSSYIIITCISASLAILSRVDSSSLPNCMYVLTYNALQLLLGYFAVQLSQRTQMKCHSNNIER